MKFFIICLLLAGNSFAAPDKTKRDAEYFGQFQLPEAPLVTHGGFLRGETGFFDDGSYNHEEYGVPHEQQYSAPHEDYGVPHEEYGVPHEEYGPPAVRELPTTTAHYCPEEDFQSAFIPSPPEIPTYPLPDVPLLKYEAPVVHEEYGVPHEEYGVPTTTPEPTTTTTTTVAPRVYYYPAPTTQPPPPPPTTTVAPRVYHYPAPTTTQPPPRVYYYPAPTTTQPPPPPVEAKKAYAAKVFSKYEHTVDQGSTFTANQASVNVVHQQPTEYKIHHQAEYKVHQPTEYKIHHQTEYKVHQPAIVAPVIRYIQPKLVIHKKVISFPLLKKKFFKFG